MNTNIALRKMMHSLLKWSVDKIISVLSLSEYLLTYLPSSSYWPYRSNICVSSKDSWPLDECQEHQHNAEEEVKHVEHRMAEDLVCPFGPLPCQVT